MSAPVSTDEIDYRYSLPIKYGVFSMQVEKVTALTIPEQAEKALAFAATEAKLKELVKVSERILEIRDADSYAECHRARMDLKNQRIAIEKLGKAAREDAKDYSKAVIKVEGQLIAIISPEEQRLQALQDAEDDKKASEKRALIEAEEKRVAGFQQRIDSIRQAPIDCFDCPSDKIAEVFDELCALDVGPVWEEFQKEAEAERAKAIMRLKAMLIDRRAAEERETKEAEERRQAEYRADQTRRADQIIAAISESLRAARRGTAAEIRAAIAILPGATAEGIEIAVEANRVFSARGSAAAELEDLAADVEKIEADRAEAAEKLRILLVQRQEQAEADERERIASQERERQERAQRDRQEEEQRQQRRQAEEAESARRAEELKKEEAALAARKAELAEKEAARARDAFEAEADSLDLHTAALDALALLEREDLGHRPEAIRLRRVLDRANQEAAA